VNELRAIVEAYGQAAREGKRTVLATVVRTSGSVYRRAGARMLVTLDSGGGCSTTGTISGGCLERDVCERARGVLQKDAPALVRYDTTADDDIVWGLGVGCNGVVEVLLEPLPSRAVPAHLSLLAACLNHHQRGVSATVFNISDAVPSVTNAQVKLGSRTLVRGDGNVSSEIDDHELAARVEDDACEALAGNESSVKVYETASGVAEVFIEVVQPPAPVVIFGAGHDAVPVAEFARKVGWHVTVVDTRARPLSRERFAEADACMLCRPEDVSARVPLTNRTMVLVMTHNYLHDLELLKTLLGSPVRYVGMLGPKRRTEQMLLEALTEDAALGENLQRLHAPVGLDLGGETPEEIALSIVAEMRAALAGRDGGFLKHRAAPIHNLEIAGESTEGHLRHEAANNVEFSGAVIA